MKNYLYSAILCLALFACSSCDNNNPAIESPDEIFYGENFVFIPFEAITSSNNPNKDIYWKALEDFTSKHDSLNIDDLAFMGTGSVGAGIYIKVSRKPDPQPILESREIIFFPPLTPFPNLSDKVLQSKYGERKHPTQKDQ